MTKVIIQADLTRYLLKMGFQIVDVKPKKENPQASVFVFKVEDGFYEALASWKR